MRTMRTITTRRAIYSTDFFGAKGITVDGAEGSGDAADDVWVGSRRGNRIVRSNGACRDPNVLENALSSGDTQSG